jgi:cupin domain
MEQPLAPGVLGSQPPTHTNEDECSFVVEGTIGVMVGEEAYEARPGSYVTKPRSIPHAFWNSGPEPARIVEIIAPAGFERYFEELAEALSAGGPPNVPKLEEIAARYGLTFHWARMGEVMERYGVGLG